MNSDNLKYVLREAVERPLPPTQERDLELPLDTRKVVGLVGVRRSGKTFLLYETMRRLERKDVPRRNMVYLNFEDDRLHPIRPEELDMVLRCFRELYPQPSASPIFLFLDEAQGAPGWERWVRRLVDTEDVRVFVTGSSSRLLQRDLSSALRGRSIALEVFPLSFREYLRFQGVTVRDYDAAAESRARAELAVYLRWGGFPEVVMADDAMRPLILEEYASLMLFRDLVERHGVRNERLMRSLLRHCFRNTATLINVSKLHKDFKSLGFAISKNTLHEYLGHLEDAQLIFLLPKRAASLRKQEHNPKKLHVIDPGLVAAFKAFPDRNLGHKLETAIFLESRRRRKDLYYYADGHEIDLCDGEGSLLLNTCWSLEDADTRRRELDALAFGRERWPQARARLIYHEYAPADAAADPALTPAWRYLLGNQP